MSDERFTKEDLRRDTFKRCEVCGYLHSLDAMCGPPRKRDLLIEAHERIEQLEEALREIADSTRCNGCGRIPETDTEQGWVDTPELARQATGKQRRTKGQ